MAEAQVANASTETVSATAPDVSAVPVVGETAATDTPAAGAQEPTIVVGTKGKSALERATEALEKHDAAAKAKPADDDAPAEKPKDDANTAKAGEADKKAEEKPKEEAKPAEEKKTEEKKEDPRIAKGLKLLADREERARIAEKRASEAVKAAEAKAASITAEYGADVTLVRSVRDLVAKGDQVAALEALGINLPRAIELMSRKIEPTAEDIQRKIVREEFEAREFARKEAEAKEAAAKAERAAAEEQVQQTEFLQKVFATDVSQFPFTVHRKVTGDQIWQYSKFMANELGRQPRAEEVLQRIEKTLRDDYESGTKLLRPADPPPAPTTAPPPKAAETPKPKAPEREEKPAEQQSRKPTKRESAISRAEAALKRAGL